MDHKPDSIAGKYSLDYYRRPLPTRSWKTLWNCAALLLALLVLGGMYIIRHDAAFQAAPVASVHSSFGTVCAACHDQSWAAVRRLTTLSDAHHSVSDAMCAKCHPAAPHTAIALKEPACAACHQEHRPERRLTHVPDGGCTRCHRDLKADGQHEVSFVSEILRFASGAAGHPEFALLRSTADDTGPRHAARQVAAFIDTGDGTGQWLDRGGLKFNHRAHLDPDGVFNPDRERVKLNCTDCHVHGPDGLMQPIRYEQHCRQCHPLRLATPLTDLDELPHLAVEQVRGVIRERLARQIERASAPPPEPTTPTRLPRLPVPALLSADQERQLAAQMERADHAVFGLEARGMCRHCHHIEQRDGDWRVLVNNPAVAERAPGESEHPAGEIIPSRWMRHATFNHKSHRAVECVACHQAETSTETADVLMPSISVCRSCHDGSAPAGSSPVRADCVLCHTYHMESHAADFHGVPLEELFRQHVATPTGSATP